MFCIRLNIRLSLHTRQVYRYSKLTDTVCSQTRRVYRQSKFTDQSSESICLRYISNNIHYFKLQFVIKDITLIFPCLK